MVGRAKVLEKHEEAKLVRELKRLGIHHIKLTSPGRRGLPDRLILLPEGKAVFIELKAPGREGKLSPNQEIEISRLKLLSFPLLVSSDAAECVEWILQFIRDTSNGMDSA